LLIDTESLKRAHPTASIVAAYGIQLRRAGTALVGRCPFHQDRGRPNLHVYRSGRWICYRCDERGDVVQFVQRMENLSFREAVARLTIQDPRSVTTHSRRRGGSTTASRSKPRSLDKDEQEVLAAAVDLYASKLLNDEHALGYLAGRGFPPAVLERYRLGYATGDGLVAYLRWRCLPVAAAVRVGLLRKDGQEVMARRITIPEVRGQQPVWLIGRVLDPIAPGHSGAAPKYLGLPGPKPLLGWDDAVRDPRAVSVVEGPLDLLALRMWGVPGIALAGSAASREQLSLLTHFDRVYLALDRDQTGMQATERLASALGVRAVRIELPADAKDVADLVPKPDGRQRFIDACLQASGSHPSPKLVAA
jgi:DNA primase catalytic core